jgi:calcineurin-like phosphoesterase family protein
LSNTYIISDTHWNPEGIQSHCERPANYHDLLIKAWKRTVRPEDTVLHLGDVIIGNKKLVKDILAELPGKKILAARGNHDRKFSCQWWMEHGFDFACDGMIFRHCWLTHEPSPKLPPHTILNVHGHLHRAWLEPGAQHTKWTLSGLEHRNFQRLFSVEYTDWRPVEFDKFLSHVEKYQSVRPDRRAI